MTSLSAVEKKRWLTEAEEEMKSLKNYQVWELVELSRGKATVSAKRVFKAKLDKQEQIHTYKARLVARGFSRRYGQDYDETYAPVVIHEAVRALFAVAAAGNLHVRHAEVKCSYLNGGLKEEIYMEQPQGFVEKGKEHNVLLFRKSTYGLKQSAR
ncbi:hypothetical protein M514_18384, partial [Trichuris suis]